MLLFQGQIKHYIKNFESVTKNDYKVLLNSAFLIHARPAGDEQGSSSSISNEDFELYKTLAEQWLKIFRYYEKYSQSIENAYKNKQLQQSASDMLKEMQEVDVIFKDIIIHKLDEYAKFESVMSKVKETFIIIKNIKYGTEIIDLINDIEENISKLKPKKTEDLNDKLFVVWNKIIEFYDQYSPFVDKAHEKKLLNKVEYTTFNKILDIKETISSIFHVHAIQELKNVIASIKTVFESIQKHHQNIISGFDQIKSISEDISDIKATNENPDQQISNIKNKFSEVLSLFHEYSLFIEDAYKNKLLDESYFDILTFILDAEQIIENTVTLAEEDYARFDEIMSKANKAFEAVQNNKAVITNGLSLIQGIEEDYTSIMKTLE